MLSYIKEITSLITAITVLSGFFIGVYKIIHRLNNIDKSQCKNYLVRFLTDKENGISLSEVETKRAYECYDHYRTELKGNSYIHDWWTRLMK